MSPVGRWVWVDHHSCPRSRQTGCFGPGSHLCCQSTLPGFGGHPGAPPFASCFSPTQPGAAAPPCPQPASPVTSMHPRLSRELTSQSP